MSERPRRLVFGEVADCYEAVRPSYPAAVIDRLVAWSEPERTALEVGAGTGMATRLVAARGVEVLAVEPSAEMAAIARRTTAGAPGAVSVVESDFESLGEREPPQPRFPLLYAAQAWHWVGQETGYAHARAWLRDGGRLVAFWNRPAWERSPLRAELSRAYARAAPDLEARGSMHPDGESGTEAEQRFWRDAIARADGFAEPATVYEDWELDYDAERYGQLIRTFSAVRLMDEPARERLVAAVGDVVQRAGGTLTVPMTVQVCSARAV